MNTEFKPRASDPGPDLGDTPGAVEAFLDLLAMLLARAHVRRNNGAVTAITSPPGQLPKERLSQIGGPPYSKQAIGP